MTRTSTRRLLLLLIVLVAPAALAQPCTTSWTDAGGGAWTDGANWDNGLPGVSDVACITLDGTYTVTASGFSVDVLRLGGASGTQTLTNTGNMALGTSGEVGANGDFGWVSGYLSGGTLINTGLIRLTGSSGARGVNGATLRNEGTVEHADTGVFFVYGGGRVENATDWVVTGDGDIIGSTGAGTFVNEATGTLTKSGGLTTVSGGGLVVENAGTLDVQEGALRFDRPSTHTDATLTTADGATLQFNAGGVTFVGTQSGAQAGTLTIDDAVTAGAGAGWAFTGTGVEWTADYLSGGTLTSTGLIRLTGSSGARGVNGATLRNEGTVEHADTGVFFVYGGGRVENATDWVVTGDGDIIGSTGAGTFVNEATGTLTKSGGLTTVSGGGLVVENAGTLDVQAGALRFDRPSTHTDATLTTADGATLQFNAGGVTFVGTQSGAQAGTLTIDDAVTAGTGAGWAFTGTGIEWTAEYLEAGTLINTGLIRLTGSTGSRGVRNADAVLRNEGTVEHADTGVFYVYGGGRVENEAMWSVTGTGSCLGSTGAGTFVNEATGTLTKSGGLTTVSGGGLVVENAGTLDVQEGALRFDRPSTHTDATLTTADGATLQFNTGGVTFVGAQSGAQAGTLTLDDAVTAGTGAGWAFTGTGIEWTAEYLEAGTLTNTGLIRLTGSTGSRGVRGATAELHNQGTVEHSDAGTFYVYSDARVENEAMWSVTGTGNYLGFTGAGTFVNANGGTFTKSGGLTTVSGGGLVVENAGTVVVESGELNVDRPFDHQFSGVIQGEGIFDATNSSPFVNDGITRPGTSPGLLTWQGDWTASSDTRLGIELGGLAPGTGHGQLAVTGTATLSGTLRAFYVGGFIAAVGQTFTIMTCTTACTGVFDLIGLPIGIEGTVDVNANDVVLTITGVGLTIYRSDPRESVVVGPEGGDFRMKYVIANPGATGVTTQTWTTLTKPDGSVREIQAPIPLVLDPGDGVRRATRILLNATAADGDYTYRRYVGTQGVDTLATGVYSFEKTALAARVMVPVTSDLAEADEMTVMVGADDIRVDDPAEPTLAEETLAEETMAEETMALRPAALPTETVLLAPYPNPASVRATVAYDLAEAAAVRVTVIDAVGRVVAVLTDEIAPAGRHRVPFDTSRLAPGLYVVTMTTGTAHAVQRMTVVR